MIPVVGTVTANCIRGDVLSEMRKKQYCLVAYAGKRLLDRSMMNLD